MLKLIAPGKRKKNKNYIILGMLRGKRHEHSTGTNVKRDAEAYKAEYERLALADQGQTQYTFGDGVAYYERTRTLDKNAVRRLARLMSALCNEPLDTITDKIITDTCHKLHAKGLPQTWNREVVAVVQSITNLCAKAEMCQWRKFSRFKSTEPSRPIATMDDMELFIAAADGPGRVVLMVLAFQGWRITETLNIQREWIDFDNCQIRRWVSKSRKWRWAPIRPEIAEAVGCLPIRDDGLVFPWRDRNNFYRDVTRPLSAKLGIKFTPHMARRCFATTLHNMGVSPLSIASAGNWESVDSLIPYIKIDIDHQRETLEKLWRAP